MHRTLFSSRSEEWTTPPQIVEVVLQILGRIDLDPCAESARAIPATTHYTRNENGLVQPWFGRVYMNPPYGKHILAWIDRVCTAYETGEIEAAVVLVHARTDTRWHERLAAYPRCFIRRRLQFGNNGGRAPFPSMLVYLGPNLQRFIMATQHLGPTYIAATEIHSATTKKDRAWLGTHERIHQGTLWDVAVTAQREKPDASP